MNPASDAWPLTSPCPRSLTLVQPFALALWPHRPRLLLLRLLLTSRSGKTVALLLRRNFVFRRKARSPQVRTHSFITQPPHLRRLIFDQKSFAVFGPLALIGNAFYVVLVHRLMIYAPRFLPTPGRPRAVALRFARLGQLAAGLAPAGVRPCWAHQKKSHLAVAL